MTRTERACCPGSIYVAASVETGTASIGLANGFTAPLAQCKDAIVKLEDTTNQGDGFHGRPVALSIQGLPA